MNHAILSLRWPAAEIHRSAVAVKYPSSGGYIAYDYTFSPERNSILCYVTGSGKQATLRFYIPKDAGRPSEVSVCGRRIPFEMETIEESEYIVIHMGLIGVEQVQVLFDRKD